MIMMKYNRVHDRKLRILNLHNLIMILILQLIIKSLCCSDDRYENKMDKFNRRLLIVNCYIVTNYTLTVGLKIIENSFYKYLQKFQNKMMHTRNGNKKFKRPNHTLRYTK